jgi:hypothetical protein
VAPGAFSGLILLAWEPLAKFHRDCKKRQGTTSKPAEKLLSGRQKRQGTTSQAAEELLSGRQKRQGTTSQAAEKLLSGRQKRQGTTSQAAEKPGFVTRARLQSGRKCNGINVGFSPCGKPLGFFGPMRAFFRRL